MRVAATDRTREGFLRNIVCRSGFANACEYCIFSCSNVSNLSTPNSNTVPNSFGISKWKWLWIDVHELINSARKNSSYGNSSWYLPDFVQLRANPPLGQNRQKWSTVLSIISWVACWRTISVGPFFGLATKHQRFRRCFFGAGCSWTKLKHQSWQELSPTHIKKIITVVLLAPARSFSVKMSVSN